MSLENVLTIFSCWAPLFGVLLLFLPLKSKMWIVLSEFSLLGLALLLYFVKFSMDPDPAFSAILVFYPLSMAIMLPVFAHKYEINRALALTLCLGFLLTGIHEIWGFVRLDLGLYDNILALKSYAAWFTPLDHLYYVVVAGLALWISKFNKRKAVSLVGWFLFGIALEWIIYPNLALHVYGPWDVARRLLWLPILMLIFYEGGRGINEKRSWEYLKKT